MLALFMAGVFIALGFWQLARHHQKQDKVRAERAAFAAPAPEIGATDPPSDASVQASGTYDAAHEVLLRDQVRGDKFGDDVLTPLRLADGTALLVDRGWVETNAPIEAPPTGPVVVHGVVQTPRGLSTQDTTQTVGGRLSMPRVDVARIQRDVPYRLRGVWLKARAQQPPPTRDAPKLPEPAQPDQVNHLEYAIQWWLLAAIPLIGWPIVLARVRRRQERSTADV